MPDLIMYTLRSCPTCAKAKTDLTADGVAFEERAIDDNPAYYEEAVELGFSVPIIVRGARVETGWKGESG
jgi:glutaredoxin